MNDDMMLISMTKTKGIAAIYVGEMPIQEWLPCLHNTLWEGTSTAAPGLRKCICHKEDGKQHWM